MKGTRKVLVIKDGEVVVMTGDLTVQRLIIKGSGELRQNGWTLNILKDWVHGVT